MPSSPKIELSDFLDNEPPEVTEAKALAKRYRLPFIDLLPPEQPSPVDIEEIANIPGRSDAAKSVRSAQT